MTAPVLTSNSPSSGYISWTAFSMAYLGKSFSFAAGNTNHKYVYWQYNNGVGTSLQFTDDPNVIVNLTPDDCLLFLNRTGLAVNALTADMLYGDLIVPGTILANQIGAHTIQASNIVAGTITTTEIATGTIKSTNLASDAITTNLLTANNVLAQALNVSDLSATTLDAVQIEGGSIAIAQGTSESTSVDFTGGTMPSGWTDERRSGNNYTNASVSVASTGVPSGSKNGDALLVNFGPSGYEDPSGTSTSAGGTVVSAVRNSENVEFLTRVYYSTQWANQGPEMLALYIRGNDTDPGFPSGGSNADLEFRISDINSSSSDVSMWDWATSTQYQFDQKLAAKFVPGKWINIRWRVTAQRGYLSVWYDTETEPSPSTVSINNPSARVISGTAGVSWDISPYLSTSTGAVPTVGQKVWFDSFTINGSNSAFMVQQDGSVNADAATFTDVTVTGKLTLDGPANDGIELGRTDGTSSSPYLDFHTGATAVDYDSRIIASMGNGSNGGGRLELVAASLLFSSPAAIYGETVHIIGNSGQPAFQNGWAWTGGSDTKPQYYKDSGGFVHISGVCGSGTIGSPIFTLPVGWRPSGDINVFAMAGGNPVRCKIYASTGQVTVIGSGTATTWYDLSPIPTWQGN